MTERDTVVYEVMAKVRELQAETNRREIKDNLEGLVVRSESYALQRVLVLLGEMLVTKKEPVQCATN